MTLIQAIRLIRIANTLFRKAARAWERGNNSGDSEALEKGYSECIRLRREAEKMLLPLGIVADYAGLMPSFTVTGRKGCFFTLESAVSAALEGAFR